MNYEREVDKIRHTASHALAQAVLQKFPNAKLAIGPAVDDGFYYDFDLGEETLSEDHLGGLEKTMKKIIAEDQKMVQFSKPVDEAIAELEQQGQIYKVELAKELKEKGETELGYYRMEDKKGGDRFTDMCAGPHIDSTKGIGAVKLLKIAGAYWRGDESKKMLQRIYGTAFATQAELDDHLARLKLAEERDHRKLGKALGLFVFSDLVGPGMPLYTPKGALVRQEIIDYTDELQTAMGYQKVHTPNINKGELFKVSGHYDKFKDDMLMVKSHYSNEEYFLKPMNCPQHTQIYASQQRSYKDLPVRFADFANLYRDEKPGELNGLTRLRCFSQDDAHCFCREDQIESEFTAVLNAINKAMKTYTMEYWIRLSLSDPAHPENYIGSRETWQKSEAMLEDILKKNNITYQKAEGEAAFYGPKMDLIARDAIGREWQISTIQLDFNMPERFELEYIDEKGERKRPVMIHRAIVGSPERFMAILIEHYGGAFPAWLAPVQVVVAPVSDAFVQHANELVSMLSSKGVRVSLDDSAETVGKKVRKAEMDKVPYVLVIGQKEVDANTVAVRRHGVKDMAVMPTDDFITQITTEITERTS